MDMQEIFVDSSYPHTLRIPNEWAFTPINNAMDIVGGNQPPKSEFANLPSEGLIRLIQIRDYKSDANKVYIPIEKAKRFVTKDDVMIGRYGPPIFQILRGLEGAYNVALMKAVPVADAIDNEFLYYYLQNRDLYNYVEAASDRTAGQSGVNKAHLEKYPFSLPPLAEQKVIADKLDTLLAQVETSKARLERISQILKTFRQSVLVAAVSGKLTEEWLAEKHTLADICDFQNGFAFKSGWFESDGEYQVIKLGNIRDGYLAIENSPAYLKSHIASEYLRFKPEAGDTLISMTGTRFKQDYGFGCLVKDEKNILVNQRVGRLIPNKQKVLPEFLNIFVRSELFRIQFFKGETGGVNQGNVGSKHIMSIRVELPSVAEQTKIVRRVEELFAFADNIEQKANIALERVNNLTQSILAKAFCGELTLEWRAANPELISGENSAEALLKKIKAERAKLSKTKPKRGKAREN